MSTYACLGYPLSDTESLIPARAEGRRRTATGLIQASTCSTDRCRSAPTKAAARWLRGATMSAFAFGAFTLRLRDVRETPR